MVELPKFLRAVHSNAALKEPPMNDESLPPPSDAAVAKAHELGNAVADLIAERDYLRNELTFYQRHTEALTDKLTRTEQERDHYIGRAQYYERFAIGIVTNFNTIRMIVDDTQRKANQIGLEPTRVEPTPVPPVEIESDFNADLNRALEEMRDNAVNDAAVKQ